MFSNWSAFTPLNYFFESLALAAFVVEAWAFGDALYRPSRAYPAAGKRTKPLWLVITGVATVIGIGTAASGSFSVVGILSVVAFVAAAIYLTDVRPRVREFRKSGGGSGTHMGPYGPW